MVNPASAGLAHDLPTRRLAILRSVMARPARRRARPLADGLGLESSCSRDFGDPRGRADRVELEPSPGIDRALPGSPRRRRLFCLWLSASHPLSGRINGQAPRVPRVVVQPGRVVGLKPSCPHHPGFPTHDRPAIGHGQGCALPVLPSGKHAVFSREQNRKAPPNADRGERPQPHHHNGEAR